MRQMHALKMNLGRRLRNEYAGEGKRGTFSSEWANSDSAEVCPELAGIYGSVSRPKRKELK